MERGYVPSRWDFLPSSSGGNNDDGRTVPRNLEEDLTNISGMSDDEKRAELSRYISSRSLFSAPHSSQINVPTLSPINPDHDEYKRPNPFPPEFGRKSEKAVARKPDLPVTTQGSLVPPVPVDSVGALTSASSNLNADGLRQQIMLAGANALAMNNPAVRAQLLLGQNNAINLNPSVISSNQPVSTILRGNLSTSVPDGLGLMKYLAPDISSLAFDRNAGYRFDPSTGLHYDANSGLFINLALRTFLRWDPLLNTYLRVDMPGLGVSPGGVTAPGSTLATGINVNMPPTGPVIPPIPSVFPSALPSPVKAPASAMNVRNLPPSSQDQFMNEIWQRMRALAKDVIGGTQVTPKSEEAVETSDSKKVSDRPDKGKHKGRSHSSSSCTTDSSSDESYSKDRNRRVSRSRSRSGSFRKRSSGKSRARKHSESPSRELRRRNSRSTRRSRSRRRNHSRGRWRSLSRGRSHSRGSAASPSGRRSHSRGVRRSRSRSVAQERRYRSRSRSRRRRRSRSRSLAQKKRRNRSRSFTRVTKRSRSRDIRRRLSTEKRSTSRSARGPSRGRRSRNRSPRRTSSSPTERNRRSRERRSPGSTKRRHLDSPNREKRGSRKNARLEQERVGNPDRHCRRKPIPEPDTPVESKSEDGQQDDSDGLSEFEFLKETLDDDNESVIVDEYEEFLEYDSPVDNLADLSKKPTISPESRVQDIGDVLGHLFPKNEGKYSIVIVAPIPLENSLKNAKALKSQIEKHQDIRNVSVYHGGGLGSPCHYMTVIFKTIEAASEWYKSHNGSLILSNEEGSQMKGYLHFIKYNNWRCEFCTCINFPMRVLCRKCYQAKDKGFSPVTVSKEPTKWVGMNKLKSCYSTVESVLESLPSLKKFDVRNIQMISEPRGFQTGMCLIEVQNDAEGTRLGKFLSERGRPWVYLIANEMPADIIDSNKIADNGNVSVEEVDGVLNNDPISKCTPELGTDIADSLTDSKAKEEDYLAPLFAENMPTKTLLISPINFSKNPKALKSELTLVETNLRTILNNDGVAYSQITLHIDRKVGAPCSYGLVDFPDAATADDWRAKHNGTLKVSFAEQCSKVFLNFSEENWYCRDCHSNNFPFRSICHDCFSHKEEDKSGPISQSTITTKWVATPSMSNWFLDDKCIVADWKKYLSDFRLVGIHVLRDPKFAVLPLGCVFETEGWGESLRLREILHRTGRFAVFATTNPEFSAFTCSSSPDDESTPKIDTPEDTIDPGANSSSVDSKTCHLREIQAQEIIPAKSCRQHLSWWGRDFVLYSEILNHLFLDNPLTRVTDSQTVLVGPLPVYFKLQALCKIITCKLQQTNVPFTTVTTHSGFPVGAPCNYALVTCETPQDAKTFVNKCTDGFILVVNPTKAPNLRGLEEPVTSERYAAFKTYLYLCKTNWRCSHCSTANFGLRSTCIACLKGNDGSSEVLTFTDTPTNCVCIRNFQKSSATEELLLTDYPSLKSRCTIKFLKEESGIPLGVCVLETSDLDEAQKLFSDICLTKRRGTRKRKDTCYGILNISNISGGRVDEGKEEPSENQLPIKSEEKSKLPCNSPVETMATEQVPYRDDSDISEGCSHVAKMDGICSAQPKSVSDSPIIAESESLQENLTFPEIHMLLDSECSDEEKEAPSENQLQIEPEEKSEPSNSQVETAATEPIENKEDAGHSRGSSNPELNAVAKIDDTYLDHLQSLSDVLDAAESDLSREDPKFPETGSGCLASEHGDGENGEPSENLLPVESKEKSEPCDPWPEETMIRQKASAENEPHNADSTTESLGAVAEVEIDDSCPDESNGADSGSLQEQQTSQTQRVVLL